MIDNFRELESDAMKFEIFGYHRSLYESIDEELKSWLTLEDNWERW